MSDAELDVSASTQVYESRSRETVGKTGRGCCYDVRTDERDEVRSFTVVETVLPYALLRGLQAMTQSPEAEASDFTPSFPVHPASSMSESAMNLHHKPTRVYIVPVPCSRLRDVSAWPDHAPQHGRA